MDLRPLVFSAVLFFCGSFRAASAQQPKPEQAGQEKPKEEKKPAPEEKVVQTKHSARIGGAEVKYTATAGTMLLKLEDARRRQRDVHVIDGDAGCAPATTLAPQITPTYFVAAKPRTPTSVRTFPTSTPTPSDGIPRITVGDNYYEPSSLTVSTGSGTVCQATSRMPAGMRVRRTRDA